MADTPIGFTRLLNIEKYSDGQFPGQAILNKFRDILDQVYLPVVTDLIDRPANVATTPPQMCIVLNDPAGPTLYKDNGVTWDIVMRWQDDVIATLQTDMTTAQSDISTLQGEMTAHTHDKLTDGGGDLTKAQIEAADAALQAQIDTNDTDILQNANDIATERGRVDILEPKVATNETDIANLQIQKLQKPPSSNNQHVAIFNALNEVIDSGKHLNSFQFGMAYRGSWDASTNAFPAFADVGDFYRVSVAGTVQGEPFNINDQIVYNGSTTPDLLAGWDHYITPSFPGDQLTQDEIDGIQNAPIPITGVNPVVDLQTFTAAISGATQTFDDVYDEQPSVERVINVDDEDILLSLPDPAVAERVWKFQTAASAEFMKLGGSAANNLGLIFSLTTFLTQYLRTGILATENFNITIDKILGLAGVLGVKIVSSGGEVDLQDQWLSAVIPLSESGETALDSYFTAISIVGALNELAIDIQTKADHMGVGNANEIVESKADGHIQRTGKTIGNILVNDPNQVPTMEAVWFGSTGLKYFARTWQELQDMLTAIGSAGEVNQTIETTGTLVPPTESQGLQATGVFEGLTIRSRGKTKIVTPLNSYGLQINPSISSGITIEGIEFSSYSGKCSFQSTTVLRLLAMERTFTVNELAGFRIGAASNYENLNGKRGWGTILSSTVSDGSGNVDVTIDTSGSAGVDYDLFTALGIFYRIFSANSSVGILNQVGTSFSAFNIRGCQFRGHLGNGIRINQVQSAGADRAFNLFDNKFSDIYNVALYGGWFQNGGILNSNFWLTHQNANKDLSNDIGFFRAPAGSNQYDFEIVGNYLQNAGHPDANYWIRWDSNDTDEQISIKNNRFLAANQAPTYAIYIPNYTNVHGYRIHGNEYNDLITPALFTNAVHREAGSDKKIIEHNYQIIK